MFHFHHDRPEDYRFTRPEKIALIIGLSPFLLLLLIFLVIETINGTFGNTECAYKLEFSNLNFIGIIKEKGKDPENHMYPYITIVTPAKDNQRIYLLRNSKILWNKLELNDSIIKRRGRVDLDIIRDTIKLKIIIPFNCDSNDFWISSKKHPGLF